MNELTYWAAETDQKKFVSGTLDRIRRFRKYFVESGRADRASRSWSARYGRAPSGIGDTSRTRPGGEQGELVDLSTNDFGTMLQHAMVLITQSKPQFKAIAPNTDFASMAQAQLADSILDAYDRKISVSEREYDATDTGMTLSEGWIAQRWNQALGEEVGGELESGKVKYSGDVELTVHTPWEIAYEPRATNNDAITWFALRRHAPRHDLAARYPDAAKDILRAGPGDILQTGERFDIPLGIGLGTMTDTDEVYFWELRHKPTPALPAGRLAYFIDEKTCMYDGPYPYEESDLHCYPFRPDRVIGRLDGHTMAFDLLGLQEFINTCATIAASNINAGGLQNLAVPNGANISRNDLGSGLNVIYYDGNKKPEAIDSLKLPPEVMQFAAFCKAEMRERSGVSDIVMGNVEKGMPAQLAALLEAKAIQFASKAQSDYYKMIERNRTGIIRLLQKFATTERKALIAGVANDWQVKEFTADSISGVYGVCVEAVNPLMKTLAGRQQYADKLLEAGHINPDQYLLLVTTGRLDAVYEGKNANLMRIRKEKELLQRGIGIPSYRKSSDGGVLADPSGLPMLAEPRGEEIIPIATDTAWLDIDQALAVVSAPGTRHDPKVVEAVMRYVEYKEALWDRMSPNMQLLRGCPPGLIRQPAAPQQQSSPPSMSGGGGPSPSPAPDMAPAIAKAAIKMPVPPANPLTGEQQKHP